VIGGGLSGLAGASAAAEAGARVVLLEAAEIGSGATGRNSGFVVPIPARVTPHGLRSLLGAHANTYIDALGSSARQLLKHTEAEPVACGWMQLFDGTQEPAEQVARARAWTSLGVTVDLLDADEVAAVAGTTVYSSGLLFHDGGSIDPHKLALYIAVQCRRQGVAVVERCSVLRMTRDRRASAYALHTRRGIVLARRILVAGNLYSRDGIANLSGGSAPMAMALGEYRLGEVDFHRVLRSGIPFSDNRHDMWFFRTMPSKNLMTGMLLTGSHVNVAELDSTLRTRIETVFRVKAVESVRLWAGRVGLTYTGMPIVKAIDSDVLAWSGCNGRGLAMSNMLGGALARRLLHGDALTLPLTKRPLWGARLLQWSAELAISRDRRRRQLPQNS
jgi:sarcosine oxidase